MDCGPVASIFVVEIHNRQQFKLIDRYIVYDSSKSPTYSHSFSRILKTTSTTVAYGGQRAPIWENGNVEYVQQRNKKNNDQRHQVRADDTPHLRRTAPLLTRVQIRNIRGEWLLSIKLYLHDKIINEIGLRLCTPSLFSRPNSYEVHIECQGIRAQVPA